MKIGFVVSYLDLTGGHVAVVEIANRLAARGNEVVLVYPARSVLSRRNDALRRLPRVVTDTVLAPLYRTNGGGLDWAEFHGEIVRVPDLDERYLPELDVVVATAWQTAECVSRGLAPRRAGRSTSSSTTKRGRVPWTRVDATWRAPFVRIATSEWLRSLALERFGIDDVVVIPYGVDLAAFYPDPPQRTSDRPRVGLLYHVEPWKGIPDALEAVKTVAETRPSSTSSLSARSSRAGISPPEPRSMCVHQGTSSAGSTRRSTCSCARAGRRPAR